MPLTNESRQLGCRRAAESRMPRNIMRRQLASGEMSLSTVLLSSKETAWVGRMKVVELVTLVLGDAAEAEYVLYELKISPRHRVEGLTTRQFDALVRWAGEREHDVR